MRNHIARFHPAEEEKQSGVVASNQRTIEQPDQIIHPTRKERSGLQTLAMLCTLELMYEDISPTQRSHGITEENE